MLLLVTLTKRSVEVMAVRWVRGAGGNSVLQGPVAGYHSSWVNGSLCIFG